MLLILVHIEAVQPSEGSYPDMPLRILRKGRNLLVRDIICDYRCIAGGELYLVFIMHT